MQETVRVHINTNFYIEFGDELRQNKVGWHSSILALHWILFAGSNPAESDGSLRAIKIRSMTSFGGEEKPLAPCRKTLRHVKDPSRYDRDTDRQNLAAIYRPLSPRFAARCSAASRVKNSGGWIGNDLNSDGERNRLWNSHRCMGRFVRYNPAIVTSNWYIKYILIHCHSSFMSHLALYNWLQSLLHNRICNYIFYKSFVM
jgi:hypothetical protein